MPPPRSADPPRPIAAGDIVTGYGDRLGEWTAAQITGIDPHRHTVGLLDLDWSGPQPTSVGDLGTLAPLRLTHHAHSGGLAHINVSWVRPRHVEIIGRTRVLVDRPAMSFGSEWKMGDQLARQRRWDAGDTRTDTSGALRVTAAALGTAVEPAAPVWNLAVHQIDRLDCLDIVHRFPALTSLRLAGSLGMLANAQRLTELRGLRSLSLFDVYGMTATDCPRPENLPALANLALHGVPAQYARAARTHWSPEIANGTELTLSRPRTARWIADNRDNPLRDWEGREHISSARYRAAVSQYRATRGAVLEALADGDTESSLVGLGRDYGRSFNELDGTRRPFIETDERDELVEALAAMVTFAETALGRSFPDAAHQLRTGLEQVRDW